MSGDSAKTRLLQELRIDRESDAETNPSGRRWLLIVLAAAVVLAVLGGLGYRALHGTRFQVDTALAAAPSAGGEASAVLQATGYVTARRQATVSAQITGALTQVLIEEGEHVKEGQVLARLDESAQKAAFSQAQAGLQTARAVQSQIEAQLAQARRDNQRNEDLIGRNLVSQQALETSQTQVATLGAQLESQRKQVELAQASVQAAQVQLDYTIVRAPFAGVIIAKAAQAGEIVSPISAGGGFTRTGVGTIVDMDSLEFEVDVNEAYINRVQPAQRAEGVLDAYPSWVIPAHVIAIIPTADRSKATVKVRIAIEQKDPRILPDMGVRVSFLDNASSAARTGASTMPSGAVLVPATAVVERDGHSVVFVVDGTHARAQAVSGGSNVGDLRAVSGIAAGARVVRSVPAGLNDGDAVAIAKE